jgi:hypothetical protein
VDNGEPQPPVASAPRADQEEDEVGGARGGDAGRRGRKGDSTRGGGVREVRRSEVRQSEVRWSEGRCGSRGQ